MDPPTSHPEDSQFEETQTRSCPVQSLPPEIIAAIFTDCILAYPEPSPLAGLGSPSLLCQICGRWRDIALSTPFLWRAIGLGCPTEEKLLLMEAWLQRSGNCFLSLQFSGRRPFQVKPWRTIPYGDLVRIIAAHRLRIEHFDAVFPPDETDSIIAEMPLLRRLILTESEPDAPAKQLARFDHSPLLTDVVLNAPPFSSKATLLPWSQLTRLEANRLDELECMLILRDAPGLVHLVATLSDQKTSDPFVHVPSHNLLALYLRRRKSCSQNRWRILGHLTLPALRVLEVSGRHITLRALETFVSRSQCTLEELRVTNAILPESAFREVLPGLERIVVE